MLSQLRINNVVLIKNLSLDFQAGLCVLTGETGAGKSILLDALGLAIGVRAESRLVRPNEKTAQVVAVFYLNENHKAFEIIKQQGIAVSSNELILRRELSSDGRSRAFINDIPVSISLLSKVGEELVEIHSQFDNQRLLNIANHRHILDSYAGNNAIIETVEKSYEEWKNIEEQIKLEKAQQEAIKKDEDYLNFVLNELIALNPQIGEEEELDKKRAMLSHELKTKNSLESAISAINSGNILSSINQAYKSIEKSREQIGDSASDIHEHLDSASTSISEAVNIIDMLLSSMNSGNMSIGEIEERLFTLRSLARKHKVSSDELPNVLLDYQEKLEKLSKGSEVLDNLIAMSEKAKNKYKDNANVLTRERQEAAKKLDEAVANSLEDLRLGSAKFITTLEPLNEENYSPLGLEKVVFLVSTNTGSQAGPLNKIASGGEMARFMLAIKVALAETDTIPTLIFDEVDAGVGGAVADAVGERLERLSKSFQVFVVTHAHQIAARAISHYKVIKSDNGTTTETKVIELLENDRVMEVARMISGITLTEEAVATAKRLIG